ncbi:RecA protein [Citreicella sp. SE45]|nr:RecA protein [Citreicella sp. SE45]
MYEPHDGSTRRSCPAGGGIARPFRCTATRPAQGAGTRVSRRRARDNPPATSRW